MSHAGRAAEAAALFARAFEREPRMWWLALEALRALMGASAAPGRAAAAPPTMQLLFSPVYKANSYQANQYSKAAEFGARVVPTQSLSIDQALADRLVEGPVVFHQQWLKEIYWGASDRADGLRRVDRHMAVLRALKALGVPVLWTLHNLLDHDLDEVRLAACSHALKEMARVADHILVHSQGSVKVLSDFCGHDLQAKCIKLEHPLYDNISALPRGPLPKELDVRRLAGRRVIGFVGMIRPYKGVSDLLDAWRQLTASEGQDGSAHLIVAGRLVDPQAQAALSAFEAERPDLLSVVGRELGEAEMAAIIDRCDLLVAPYRKILISGSYYLATSFAKPLLAPALGMFPEVIEDGESGYLYEGGPAALAARLGEVLQLPAEALARAGRQALDRCSHLSIAQSSERYFRFLGLNR